MHIGYCRRGFLVSSVLSLGLTACSSSAPVFTLYRNSAIDPAMRIHVASFDTANAGTYNQENCWLAQTLFAAQPGIKTRFWCEAGRFRN